MAEVIELDTSPWERAGEFLSELQEVEEFRDFTVEAKCARIQDITDVLILRLVKTKLQEAETKKDFLRFQAMVVSLLQIRNAITGKLITKSREEQELQSGRN